MQLDRNSNNIGFQIKKIPDVNYKQRLRKETLFKIKDSRNLLVEEDGVKKLKGLIPSKVYDNERILGIDHKNVFTYNSGDIWTPIWPYKLDLIFETQEEAKRVSENEYCGLDPNLVELFINYPECKEILERLAYGDEYKEVLEDFNMQNSQVRLSNPIQEYFENIMEERRDVFKKVLTF